MSAWRSRAPFAVPDASSGTSIWMGRPAATRAISSAARDASAVRGCNSPAAVSGARSAAISAAPRRIATREGYVRGQSRAKRRQFDHANGACKHAPDVSLKGI